MIVQLKVFPMMRIQKILKTIQSREAGNPQANLKGQKLKTQEEDPTYIVKFKEVLQRELNEICLKNLNFPVLSKASFFDKRYAKLSFIDKLDFTLDPEKKITKEMILSEIRAELELVEREMSRNENHVSGSSDAPPQPKKTKFLSTICDDNDNIAAITFNHLKELV